MYSQASALDLVFMIRQITCVMCLKASYILITHNRPGLLFIMYVYIIIKNKLLYAFIITNIGYTGLRGQVGVPGTKGDKGYL